MIISRTPLRVSFAGGGTDLKAYYGEEAGAVITDTDNYILTVESWGQLNCKDILEHAAEIIIQKVDALEEQIK